MQNVVKITPLQTDHTPFTLHFVFLMRQTLGRQTMANYLWNAWSQESKFRWPNLSELVTWHEFNISFLTKAYFITSGTHIWKICLITEVTAEIFKNCSIGNLFKYISVVVDLLSLSLLVCWFWGFTAQSTLFKSGMSYWSVNLSTLSWLT